jgi:Mg2+ and Co2+ transporter CorA
MSGLVRDTDSNRIISYTEESSILNQGKVEVPVLDERFLTDNFRYIVKSEFKSLPNAIEAESIIFRKLEESERTILFEAGLPADLKEGMQLVKEVAKNQLLSELTNLAQQNQNSVAALRKKISDLETALNNSSDLIENMANSNDRLNDFMQYAASENSRQSTRIQYLENINRELQRQQENSIDLMSARVQNQQTFVSASLSNIYVRNQEAYDLLSKQVSELREIGNLPDLNGVIDVNYGEG